MTEPTPGIDWRALPARPWTAVEYDEDTYGVASPDGALENTVEATGSCDRNLLIAQLWAAAPELYEALKAYVEAEDAELEDGQFCDRDSCAECAPRSKRLAVGIDALAKAEGPTE